MLRVGAVLLSFWAGAHIFLAFLVLTLVIALGETPLVSRLVLTGSEIAALDPSVIAIVSSLAVLLNASGLAFSLLVLLIIWKSMVKGERWAYWGLLVSIGLVQGMQLFGYAAMGRPTWPASLTLLVIYLAGTACCGLGMRKGVGAQ